MEGTGGEGGRPKLSVSWAEVLLVLLLTLGASGAWTVAGRVAVSRLAREAPDSASYAEKASLDERHREVETARDNYAALRHELTNERLALLRAEARIEALGTSDRTSATLERDVALRTLRKLETATNAAAHEVTDRTAAERSASRAANVGLAQARGAHGSQVQRLSWQLGAAAVLGIVIIASFVLAALAVLGVSYVRPWRVAIPALVLTAFLIAWGVVPWP
jgi:hypothetical protein